MAFVDDLTALLASAAADADIIYVGKPGDGDPDRQMTLLQAALALLVRAGNGSAGAPSVAFDSDPNTGIYREAADQLGLVAGGTRRVRVQNASPHLQVNDGSLRTVWHDGNAPLTVNADGTALRFPNGIQVCWQRAAPSIAIDNSSTKGGYLSANQAWDFPQWFNADPFLFISIEATAGVSGNMDRFSLSSARWRLRSITSQVASSSPVYLLAIGTWS